MLINIIDPNQASYTKILEGLQQNVEARIDFDSWKDFYESGSGVTITQLLAGFGAFLSYNALSSRRESGLYTAKLRSSVYAICDTLGYPPNRKVSAQIQLQIRVITPIFCDRETPLGYLGGTPLSLVNSFHFTGGTHLTDIICGKWESFTYTSDTNRAFAEVQFPDTDIDSIDNRFIELYINGELVELTLFPEELTTNNVLIKTMADRISLIFGFQNLGRQLLKGDSIEVKYIRVGNLPTTGYNLSNVSLDIVGVVVDELIFIENLASADSMLKLTRVASGYFATKRRMVSAEDHEYLIMSYPGILGAKVNPGWCQTTVDTITTNHYEKYYERSECRAVDGDWQRPFECCTIEVAYLYTDEHIMLDTEEEALIDYLDDFRMQGEELTFRDPEVVMIDAQVTLVIQEGTDISGFDQYIRDELGKQMFILGGTFYTANIVTAGNLLVGVVRTYLTKPIVDKRLPFWKYFKLRSLDVSYTTNANEVLEFGSSQDSGYQLSCEDGYLCLSIAKSDNADSGEFEVWVDGELWHTGITTIPYNTTGDWEKLSLPDLNLVTGVNHIVILKPVDSTSNILVNKVIYDNHGYEAEVDGIIGATQGAQASGGIIFSSYIRLTQYGTLTFNILV